MLDPRTSFRPQFAKINGLQCEKAQLAGFVFRQEFLLTHDTEIAHEHLRPYGAFPTVLFRLHQLKAGFDALAVKCRADFASRSEERRVGKAWVSTCRSRGSPCHKKKNRIQYI